MRFVFISDTHNCEAFDVPDGDVLVHCGDLTLQGTPDQLDAVAMWLGRFAHKHKVVIAGNHDWIFQVNRKHGETRLRPSGAIYLQDSAAVIDGIKLYGSPWQPWFCDWAFNFPKRDKGLLRARKTWGKIPTDTDVLITHGPVRGILDPDLEGKPVGDVALFDRLKVVRPLVHAFGHLHSGNGVLVREGTVFVNACICNEQYEPVQPAHVVDVDIRARKVTVIQ